MDTKRIWIQDLESILKRVETLPVVDSDKINLVFDFDGVITKPQDLKSEVLRQRGYDIAPEQTDNENAQRLMLQQKPEKGKEGIKADYEAMVSELYVDRMMEVPPEEHAIDVLQRLSDSGRYSLYIVTSRRSSPENREIQAAGKWLQKHGLRFDAIINTSNQNKREDLKALRPTLFVDDSIGKLSEIFEDPEDCTALDDALSDTYFALFRNKANPHVKPKGLVGVIENGWLELESRLSELAPAEECEQAPRVVTSKELKNKLENLQGLPPRVQRSLKILFKEPAESLELSIAYDILGAYLSTPAHTVRFITNPKEIIPTITVTPHQEIRFPAFNELVDFIFEHFNLGDEPLMFNELVSPYSNKMCFSVPYAEAKRYCEENGIYLPPPFMRPGGRGAQEVFVRRPSKLERVIARTQEEALFHFNAVNDISLKTLHQTMMFISILHLEEKLGRGHPEVESLWRGLSMKNESSRPPPEKKAVGKSPFEIVSSVLWSRNEVFSITPTQNLVCKLFPCVSEGHWSGGNVVEYDMIETFRDVAKQRPELGLGDSLPTVRYYSIDLPCLEACLVTEIAGEPLEQFRGKDNFKEILRSAVKLLAGIHAASLEFPEGKLTDIVAQKEAEKQDYFEWRIESLLFDNPHLSQSPDKLKRESFKESYDPISSKLKTQPRFYYKDANLRNWLYSPHQQSLTAIDFEKNWALPPQLDLVALLEYNEPYLDDEGIDKMLQVYHTNFCEYSHQDIPFSDFKEAYPYAAVQRHLEQIGYHKGNPFLLIDRADDLSQKEREERLQAWEKELKYRAHRCLHYLSYLAEKHSGTEKGDNILRLKELLPQIFPQFTAGQP